MELTIQKASAVKTSTTILTLASAMDSDMSPLEACREWDIL